MARDESSASARHLGDPKPSSPPPPKPEALMADIEVAITSLEHSRATAMLPSATVPPGKPDSAAGLADEAYKSACAAMAAGRPDVALRWLRLALVGCPPDKASAMSKIRSLIAFASIQQHRRQ